MRPSKTAPITSLAWLLFVLCWLSLHPAQASPEIALTPAERAWLAAHPTIQFGSDAHWRPYVWARDDDTPSGIEIDRRARRASGLPGCI